MTIIMFCRHEWELYTVFRAGMQGGIDEIRCSKCLRPKFENKENYRYLRYKNGWGI